MRNCLENMISKIFHSCLRRLRSREIPFFRSRCAKWMIALVCVVSLVAAIKFFPEFPLRNGVSWMHLETFDCRYVCPPWKWTAWSSCTHRCEKGTRKRKVHATAVCIGTSMSCPKHGDEEFEECNNFPCSFKEKDYGGDGEWGHDGLPPKPPNPFNPPLWMDHSKEPCQQWIKEYQKTHKAILSGVKPPSYLVYSTVDTHHVPTGLAGRLKGMSTVFTLAVLLGRAFLIEWDGPTPLPDYLQPNLIDWRLSMEKIKLPDPETYHDIASWSSINHGQDANWYMQTDFRELFKEPVEVVRSPSYDFSFALMNNKFLKLQAYKLKMDLTRCLLCCMWYSLFQFNPHFEEDMITRLRYAHAAPEDLVAIQQRSVSIQSQSVRHLVSCAEVALKATPFGEGRMKFVLITNRQFLYHFTNRTVTSKYAVFVHPFDTLTGYTHIHLGSKHLPKDNTEVLKEVTDLTFQHFYVLMKAAILVREKGHAASLGVLVDAIRRHLNPKMISYVADNKTCKAIPPDYLQFIV